MFFVPKADLRYADSGRRVIQIGDRADVHAHLAELRPVERQRFVPATHQLTVRAMAPPPRDSVIDFDGTLVRVTGSDDPNRDNPAMRRKFLRILCTLA